MSYLNQIRVEASDTGIIDAFGRLRISSPHTVFDSKQIYNKQPLFWIEGTVSGSGTLSTYNANQASTTLSVSSGTAGKIVRQSKRWHNYQPGKSQLTFMTGVLGTGLNGIIKRMGAFYEDNGVFLELNGTSLNIVKRSKATGSIVDFSVSQENWNLDTMNGSGGASNPSGINIDVTKTQIFITDFEWLGVGRVRCGFVMNGLIYYVHEFLHANLLNVVYMSTPNLPLRFEIENVGGVTGSGSQLTLTHICCAVSSEGGIEDNGYRLGIDLGSTPLVTLNDTNQYPLIAIRLGSSFFGATIRVNEVNIMSNSTTDYRWALLLNPTIVGTALSYSALTNSSIEYALPTNGTTVTGGTLLRSGYGRGTSQAGGEVAKNFANEISIGQRDFSGNSDQLMLAVQRITGTTESFWASLSFNELI